MNYIKQVSKLSIFTGIDEKTGELLPQKIWSEKAWTTFFAETVNVGGLTLYWGDSTIYFHNKEYKINSGSYKFTVNNNYSQSIIIWLDDTSTDYLTIDISILDGQHSPEPAPTANGDILKLGWGTIAANSTDMSINILYHIEEQ